MNNSYRQLPLFLPPTDGALAPQVPLTADIHYLFYFLLNTDVRNRPTPLAKTAQTFNIGRFNVTNANSGFSASTASEVRPNTRKLVYRCIKTSLLH